MILYVEKECLIQQKRIMILMMRGYRDQMRSYDEVRNLFNDIYTNQNPVSKSGVQKTIQLLQETGCVKDSLKHGRTKWDENEALSLNVLQSNVEDLLASTSQQ